MERKLEGKVAFVTGAARGIGRSIALELARQGADIALNDLCSPEVADDLLMEIRNLGVQAHFVQADVSINTNVEMMIADVLGRYGHIDILVNNAAYSVRKFILDMTIDEASRSLAVTLWGSYLCSYHVAHEMVSRKTPGAIIMIGSVHGKRPYPNAAPYNMAKAGLSHLSASLALELAPYSIRVNTIEPGWIDTPGERLHNSEQSIEEKGKTLPLKRLGSPEEIARVVSFLCSEEASYITGANLRVDGGFALKF